jgi:hypothetical protein
MVVRMGHLKVAATRLQLTIESKNTGGDFNTEGAEGTEKRVVRGRGCVAEPKRARCIVPLQRGAFLGPVEDGVADAVHCLLRGLAGFGAAFV